MAIILQEALRGLFTRRSTWRWRAMPSRPRARRTYGSPRHDELLRLVRAIDRIRADKLPQTGLD